MSSQRMLVKVWEVTDLLLLGLFSYNKFIFSMKDKKNKPRSKCCLVKRICLIGRILCKNYRGCYPAVVAWG